MAANLANLFQDLGICGYDKAADSAASAHSPNAIDPKLIERIARAMCKADGNDPELMCYQTQDYHLCGVARSAKVRMDESCCSPAWHLYYRMAEAAILELEAAAMEPFQLSPGKASSEPPEVPVERTPWYPPRIAQLELRPPGYDEFFGKYAAAAENITARADAIFAHQRSYVSECEQPVSSAADAPLREAIRRAKEKNGF